MMDSEEIRITSKSSIVQCCTSLLETSLNTLIFQSWKGGNNAHLLVIIKNLLVFS